MIPIQQINPTRTLPDFETKHLDENELKEYQNTARVAIKQAEEEEERNPKTQNLIATKSKQ